MPNGDRPFDDFLVDISEHGGLSRAVFDADLAEDPEFHDWNLRLEYEDGTVESMELGTWDEEPPDWVWEIYDWYIGEGIDVDTDYEEAA